MFLFFKSSERLTQWIELFIYFYFEFFFILNFFYFEFFFILNFLNETKNVCISLETKQAFSFL